jgi:dihydroorotate dehydrogenase (NAD+) catalytic subunit
MTADADPMLATDLAGMPLRTPVILAAGTAGTLGEMADILDLSRVGALVTKSITPEPRAGNAPWRVAPLKAGMLNAIGLANPGIDAFAEHHAPNAAAIPTTVIGSVAGFSVDDYCRVAAEMDAIDALPAVELNVSCPNVKHGVEIGADPTLLAELIRAVRPLLASTRLMVKLPPVTTGTPHSMVDLARACIDPDALLKSGGASPAGPNSRPGCDALSLCNTTPGMAIDVRTRRPRIGNGTGGLSGPAVHNAIVRLVHLVHTQIARDTGTPIVGIGGVMAWDDAAELILAGATAVEIGTALFADPAAPIKVAKGLRKWGSQQGVTNLSELVGAVELT